MLYFTYVNFVFQSLLNSYNMIYPATNLIKKMSEYVTGSASKAMRIKLPQFSLYQVELPYEDRLTCLISQYRQIVVVHHRRIHYQITNQFLVNEKCIRVALSIHPLSKFPTIISRIKVRCVLEG